jgi:nucleoid-associated protein EbfC
MFGDLMGNMKERQAELQASLSRITVEASAGEGAIQVVAAANRQVLNIRIDKDRIDVSDTEQLEDLLLVAVNRALDLATQKERDATQDLVKSMLPPGFDHLLG